MPSVVAVLLLALAPQGGDEVFALTRQGGGSEPERVLVAADKQSIRCHEALRHLGVAMNWSVVFESRPLEAELRQTAVDLNFAGQEPRMVGQLVAIAGGADAVFDDGEPAAGLRPTMHIVRTPDANTESGRQRLRAQASQWYRSFLVDELRHEPLVDAEGMKVRMHLGHLLIDSGDLESAIAFFTQVYDGRPNELVPTAMLRIAECALDLAGGQRDHDQRLAQYKRAEEWARKVLDAHPSSPAATKATIALGHALLGQQRFDECRTEMAARVMRLLDTVEMLEVWLLVGEAQYRLQWPTRVYETMLMLREAPDFGDLDDRQFLDYHFLLGYGALGSGKPELAMKSMEWFLIHGQADRRRAQAYVLLGQSYFEQKRYVEARAAAVEARQHQGELDDKWRREAQKLYARTGLLLADKDEAFRELELLVHRQDDPELTLFLVDELLADRQWQWAISVASLLQKRDGVPGDTARFRIVQALYEQGTAAKNLADFPAQAVELALRIQQPPLRSRCAELIGNAYEQLGKPEHAADAYRGILR